MSTLHRVMTDILDNYVHGDCDQQHQPDANHMMDIIEGILDNLQDEPSIGALSRIVGLMLWYDGRFPHNRQVLIASTLDVIDMSMHHAWHTWLCKHHITLQLNTDGLSYINVQRRRQSQCCVLQ
ncbi:hypothetical protein ORF 518L [Red seabream iridovirus]|uniref:Uncharacterized protein n=2 Tax=Infectious spleen and kidney necrosis virus TaxID=180170 RepID=A0A3S9LMJ0_ISKNV|nr:hypothetical protein [Pompano iridovirus]AZQ20958.1 hypothetical protein [Pompano iridovirus]AZQ21091.1 hypothetical protein [Pompano iridovirus]WDW26040.2 hypothetical protein FD201807_107R [Megalocytivirus FD201807]BAK14302.1 hypothetical protein ORF 518L [Red seabream iridovirus]